MAVRILNTYKTYNRMDEKSIAISLIRAIDEDLLETFDNIYKTLEEAHGKIDSENIYALLNSLAPDFQLNYRPVSDIFISKTSKAQVPRIFNLAGIKKILRKYLDRTYEISQKSIRKTSVKIDRKLSDARNEKKTFSNASKEYENFKKGNEEVEENYENLGNEKNENDEGIEKENSEEYKEENEFKLITEVAPEDKSLPHQKLSINSRTSETRLKPQLAIENEYSSFSENETSPNASNQISNKKANSFAGSEVFQNSPRLKPLKFILYKLEDITLQEFQKRIQSKQEKLIENLASARRISSLLVELMSACKIVPKPADIPMFVTQLSKAQCKNLFRNSKSKHKKAKKTINLNDHPVTFEIFFEALKLWYSKIHFPSDLQSKLALSVKEYENIKLKMLPNEDQSFIDSLISTLKGQLRKINETSVKPNEKLSLEEKGRNGAHEIFLYYSNQNEDLSRKGLELMILPKFLQFTKDFSVVEEHKNPSKNRIKIEVVEEIFEKCSNPKRDMHEYQFFEALEELSLVFFDEEFDQANRTHWGGLPDKEKVIKFYEVLGLHEPAIYMKKVKGSRFQDSFNEKSNNNESKLTSFTPKVLALQGLIEKSPQKNLTEIIKNPKHLKTTESQKLLKEIPVTWEKLNNMKSDPEYNLLKFIDETSNEEPEKKGKKLSNSISSKTYKRADELAKLGKKKEDERLQHLYKVADEKTSRFSRKQHK